MVQGFIACSLLPDWVMAVVMFRIKICGITNVDDARAVAKAGVDAVGLNFHAKSPRCISTTTARTIAEVLPRDIVKVGLFVNADVDVIVDAWQTVGFDLIQLHGDEPPEYLHELTGVCAKPIMRAFRLGPEGIEPILAYLDQCRRLGSTPRMILMDSHRPGSYGGTGETSDWGLVHQLAQSPGLPPLVLAGGLTPENVAEAIAAARPAAVDAASGVESIPGRKNPVRVRQFVEAAQKAMTKNH